MHIRQSTYSQWENGINNIDNDSLRQLAEILDVSVSYILGEDDQTDDAETELTDYLEELKNRSEMRMLFKVSKNATKEDIEKTVKMLEAWGYKDDGDCEGC